MKFLEFTYTKQDGSKSDRAVIELVTPTKFIEGIDVSQLPEADFAVLTATMSEMKRVHHEETMELLESFDLKHNYRRFIPDNMTNVVTEYI